MKYALLALIFIAAKPLMAQQTTLPDIQNIDSVNTRDMYRMMSLLGLDIKKYSISPDFKDYYCNLILEEYKNGKLVNSFNAKQEIGKLNSWVIKVGNNLENGQFPIAFYMQEYEDTLVKVKAHLGELQFNKKLIKWKDLSYTWKEIYNIKNYIHKIIPFKKYPLLAYTSQVDQLHAKTKGAAEFCLINGDEVPVEDWYKSLGIQHFYIYYLLFEK